MSVNGVDKSGVTQVREFKPLYARYDDAGADAYAFYSTRRVQRVQSQASRLRGPRSGYIGTEVYVTLADPQSAPWPVSVVQLAVDTLSTNRDLPLTLTVGSANDFFLEENTPVKGVRCIRGPTRPRDAGRRGQGNVARAEPPVAQLPVADRQRWQGRRVLVAGVVVPVRHGRTVAPAQAT